MISRGVDEGGGSNVRNDSILVIWTVKIPNEKGQDGTMWQSTSPTQT